MNTKSKKPKAGYCAMIDCLGGDEFAWKTEDEKGNTMPIFMVHPVNA